MGSYTATMTKKGEHIVLTFDDQPPLLQKLSVYEFTYAKAVEQAERMISELTLDPDPQIKVLLID